MKSKRLYEHMQTLRLMAVELRQDRDTAALAEQIQTLHDFDFSDVYAELEDGEQE